MSVAGNAAKTPFDLIIFDCDGVLVDSEVISTHTLLETLVASGVKIDIDYVRKTYLGRSMSVVEETRMIHDPGPISPDQPDVAPPRYARRS